LDHVALSESRDASFGALDSQLSKKLNLLARHFWSVEKNLKLQLLMTPSGSMRGMRID
jgi:hypothetical protein